MRREDAPPSNSIIADTLMLFFSRSEAAVMSYCMLEVCSTRPSSLLCMKNTQATFRQKSSIIQAPVAHPEGPGRVEALRAVEGR